MENKKILIALAIILLFLFGGISVTEREISCEGYNDCYEKAKEIGLDKTVIMCKIEDGQKKCKIIVD